MKKLGGSLLVIAAICGVFAVSALAGTGTAKKGQPYTETMTITAPGTVTATFDGKKNVGNLFDVVTSPASAYDCHFNFDGEYGQAPGPQSFTCVLPAPGTYTAYFYTFQQPTDVTFTWS